MTDSPFAVRSAVDADLDALPDAHARAELRTNPAGWRGVAVSHRGRTVGFWGAKTLPMIVRGERVRFGVFAGCFLERAYRSGGLHSVFAEMDETFAELHEGRDEGRFACVVGRFAESDWWTLRRLRDFTPVRTEVDLVLEGVAARRASATDEKATRADDALFAHWTEPLSPDEIGVVRDGPLMHAREKLLVPPQGGPAHGTRVVVRDGRVVAAALFDDSQDGVAEIRDWCVPEGDDSAAKALLDALFASRAPAMVAPVFGRSPWLLFLQRAGFQVRPAAWGGEREPYLVARSSHPRCDAERLAETWFVTAADVCRFPMPPCQIPEPVTTPPPAGTRSGSDRHA
jgi:hypothetical protein